MSVEAGLPTIYGGFLAAVDTPPHHKWRATRPLFIEPGSPWEDGYVESFFGKLRDELLKREILYTLTETRVLIERWRQHYNQLRSHRALGYRPTVP